MSIDELRTQHTNLIGQFDIAVQPLRERFREFGINVWWQYTGYKIGKPFLRMSMAFHLDDEKLERLLALSDNEMSDYLKSLGVIS